MELFPAFRRSSLVARRNCAEVYSALLADVDVGTEHLVPGLLAAPIVETTSKGHHRRLRRCAL
jgi:DNA-binding transcriptional MocR family regulator